nr:P-loop NTPase [uncultured Desulfobacter sp.]
MKTVNKNEFVHQIYLVSSGKGGQGKSTIAVNIAAALLLRGNRVGILDADIYGPAIPRLLGAHIPILPPDKKTPLPMQNFGIQILSLESLVSDRPGVLMREKANPGTMERLMRQIEWNNLDFLIVDLPSGARDIQDMIVKTLTPDGAVIVTTPHQACREDVRQHVCMLQQQGVPIIGLVENMVSWCCEKCGHVESFYTGSTDRWCQIETIAVLPMERSIWKSSQKGVPLVFDPVDTDLGQTFDRIATRLEYKHIETGC